MDDRCPVCAARLNKIKSHIHMYGEYQVLYFCAGDNVPDETSLLKKDIQVLVINRLVPIENEQRIETMLLLK